MLLLEFIRTHHDTIVADFEEFARTLMPPGSNMTAAQLRDHAEELLTAMERDLNTHQSSGEQHRKSRGQGAEQSMAASGHLHADARIQHGFTPAQLLAEFRALRASVLRLYESGHETPDLHGVRRFNESVDEALTESMTRYTAMTDRYRDQFVGVLGHDLRNPLNAISAGAALLTVSGDGDSRQQRVAARILRSSQRMGRMIDDLLDLTLARLGGAIPLKRTTTDLASVCQEVLLEIQAAHSAAHVRLECTGDLRGEWDADRLAQTLSNLVGNAIQHGDKGIVSVTAAGSTEEAVVSVHNFGPAIPAESLKSIFEPLVRGSASDAEGNSIGLGLFIAQAIVNSHNGQIAVTSTPTAGTTFTIRVPKSATAR